MRTWPPSTKGAWYSSDSAQQIFSGSHDGTVAARVPPGFSTRTTSCSDCWSSLTCSSTSDAMIRSTVESANGGCSAPPLTAVAGDQGPVPAASEQARGGQEGGGPR